MQRDYFWDCIHFFFFFLKKCLLSRRDPRIWNKGKHTIAAKKKKTQNERHAKDFTNKHLNKSITLNIQNFKLCLRAIFEGVHMKEFGIAPVFI